MPSDFSQRLDSLRSELKKQKLHGIIVRNPLNNLYLSGFSSSNSIIVITQTAALYFTDFRYIEKATGSIKEFEVKVIPQHGLTEIATIIRKLRIRKLGFEESASYESVNNLAVALGEGIELVPGNRILLSLRAVKSSSELRLITANQKLNEKIFVHARDLVRTGMTESDIRNQILHTMINEGCEEAFSSIIAAAKNSSLPHAVPGNTKVKKGGFLLFDMGIKKNYYHSDMTRTVAVGKISNQLKEIYEIVLEAQQAALQALKPGKMTRDIDAIARNIISKAGYGQYFGHGLGHGVGLEIHEGPTLNAKSTDILKPGMVVTIEPGIYLPRIGGVRIEDMAVITENGYKNLNHTPKELQTITID